jgi:hypothetical protein
LRTARSCSRRCAAVQDRGVGGSDRGVSTITLC